MEQAKSSGRRLMRRVVRRLNRLVFPRLARERDRHREQDRKLREQARKLDSLRRRADELAARRTRSIRSAREFGTAYRRILAASLGVGVPELGPAADKAPSSEVSSADSKRVREMYDRGRIVRLLQEGSPLDEAVADMVRAYGDRPEKEFARSLSQALLGDPATRVAGHVGLAVLGHRVWPALAWHYFTELDTDTWQRTCPVEYVQTAFRQDRAVASAAVEEIVDRPPATFSPDIWVKLVQVCFGAGEEKFAEKLFTIAEGFAADAPDVWRHTAVERDWLRPWVDKALRPRPLPEIPVGDIPLAVLDYKSPDRDETSSNLGDYVQTLASLTHLVRHRNLTFRSADPELADFVSGLQDRVRPELVLDTAERAVTLLPFQRDASNYDTVPEGTWAVVFGWYMQSIFGRYDFPLHPNLRPILVSFHINRLEVLTPEAIAYLKAHGPVGCRDWTTVDLLLSAGVPAFFSGCLTTTVGGVFPDLPADEVPGDDAPVIYVDTDAPEDAQTGTQAGDRYRDDSLVPNLHAAVELLDGYRRSYSTLVTSRLHCYLPGRSVGVDVDFRPKNKADIRFAGLQDLTDEGFFAMRDGIRAKLAAVLTAIVAGKTAEEVYAVWREVCADDVAAARARRESVPRIAPPSVDVAAACATVRAEQVIMPRTAPVPEGDEVHVALALDGNLKSEMDVVVAAMADNCSRPLHLWILCRDHSADDFAAFADRFPEVTTTWLPCDHVDYGPISGMLRHITVSTMDRLLLPDLLPELDRIVYHDIDALPLGDVATLYEWDLAGQPLAARAALAENASSGFGNIYRGLKRLRQDPDATGDLLHRMHARHGFDYAAFNAGILVLDLARMRADEFSRDFIPFVECYGMNDQEILNCYAGPNRAPLPPAWNAWPIQEVITDPRIIHWAGALKPWKPEYVLFRDRWQEYVARVAQRQSAAQARRRAATSVDEVIARVRRENLTYLNDGMLRDLADAVAEADREGRPGVIVEAGAARGGSAIVMAAVKADGRRLKVYDAFGMIPPPTDADGEKAQRRYETIASGASAGVGEDTYYGYRDDLLAEVTDSFARFGVPVRENDVDLVEGYFADTLRIDDPVAVAHVDSDWYESTMTCLERIVPRLVPGGRLVIDDYDHWEGCRKAVDEFFDGRTGFRFERKNRLHIVKL